MTCLENVFHPVPLLSLQACGVFYSNSIHDCCSVPCQDPTGRHFEYYYTTSLLYGFVLEKISIDI